jgi:hypothetical protein
MSETILTPGPGYRYQIPRAPCVQREARVAPLNAWAKNQVTAPMMNIDGKIIQSHTCLYACSRDPNDMVIPVPEGTNRYYTIPGGVPSAVRLFKPCPS